MRPLKNDSSNWSVAISAGTLAGMMFLNGAFGGACSSRGASHAKPADSAVVTVPTGKKIQATIQKARATFRKMSGAGDTNDDWNFITTLNAKDCSVSDCFEGACLTYRYRDQKAVCEGEGEPCATPFSQMTGNQMAYINTLRETLPSSCR